MIYQSRNLSLKQHQYNFLWILCIMLYDKKSKLQYYCLSNVTLYNIVLNSFPVTLRSKDLLAFRIKLYKYKVIHQVYMIYLLMLLKSNSLLCHTIVCNKLCIPLLLPNYKMLYSNKSFTFPYFFVNEVS